MTPRDCEHGQLAGSCETCALQEELRTVDVERRRLQGRDEEVRATLARALAILKKGLTDSAILRHEQFDVRKARELRDLLEPLTQDTTDDAPATVTSYTEFFAACPHPGCTFSAMHCATRAGALQVLRDHETSCEFAKATKDKRAA